MTTTPAPQYRASNPKIDVFVNGRYVYSTNWHRTCRDAKAAAVAKYPAQTVRAMIDHRSR